MPQRKLGWGATVTQLNNQGTFQQQNEDFFSLPKSTNRDFPGGPVVKNSPSNTVDLGSIPGPGRSHVPWGN